MRSPFNRLRSKFSNRSRYTVVRGSNATPSGQRLVIDLFKIVTPSIIPPFDKDRAMINLRTVFAISFDA